MPTYEYKCKNPLCNKVIEKICRIKDHVDTVQCPYCGSDAPQLPSRIAVHDDHPLWLTPKVVRQIQDDGEKPIETRAEYDRHCKENGIVATSARKF